MFQDFLFSLITQPFAYDFFSRALIAAVLCCTLLALIGVHIVLRRMSYIGHGLGHAALGGAAASYVGGINFYIGATVWSFLSVLAIDRLAKTRIGTDALIGIVCTAGFAFGVALLSRVHSFSQNFEAALFGNILAITPNDMLVILAIFLASIAVLIYFYRRLLFTTFDPDAARAYGVSVDLINLLFSIVLAVSIIASMQIIGVTLVAAAIVAPPSAARLLTSNFWRITLLSGGIGLVSGILGLYASYYLDVASGSAIVLSEALVFTVALAYSRLSK